MTFTPRDFDDWYVEVFNSRTGTTADPAVLDEAAWDLAGDDTALSDSYWYLGDTCDPALVEEAELLAAARFDTRSVFSHVHYVALCALYLEYRERLETALAEDPAAT